MNDDEFRREANLMEANEIVSNLEKFISESSMHLDERFKMLAKPRIGTDVTLSKTDEGQFGENK